MSQGSTGVDYGLLPHSTAWDVNLVGEGVLLRLAADVEGNPKVA